MHQPSVADVKVLTQRMTRALGAAGLPRDMGAALRSLAGDYIRDHDHLATLLTEAAPEDRLETYEALRPHLKFAAHPLDWYVARAKEMAERQKLPVLLPDGKLAEFRPAQDISTTQKQVEGILQQALAAKTLILRCSKCTQVEKFFGTDGETKVDVIIRARRKGWIYDGRGKTPVEICPECPTSLREAHEAHFGKVSNG